MTKWRRVTSPSSLDCHGTRRDGYFDSLYSVIARMKSQKWKCKNLGRTLLTADVEQVKYFCDRHLKATPPLFCVPVNLNPADPERGDLEFKRYDEAQNSR
jgi:hypothetical protein